MYEINPSKVVNPHIMMQPPPLVTTMRAALWCGNAEARPKHMKTIKDRGYEYFCNSTYNYVFLYDFWVFAHRLDKKSLKAERDLVQLL